LLFREIIPGYLENHAKHVNVLWGKMQNSFNVKAGSMYTIVIVII
jgi:hypothetical protein